MITGAVLRFPVPYAPCLILIGLSLSLNVALMLSPAGRRVAQSWEAGAQLAFDILILSGLLYLTGGTVNPFSLLLIAPVTLGRGHPAGALWPGPRHAGDRRGLIIIAFAHLPMPWSPGHRLELLADLSRRLGPGR